LRLRANLLTNEIRQKPAPMQPRRKAPISKNGPTKYHCPRWRANSAKIAEVARVPQATPMKTKPIFTSKGIRVLAAVCFPSPKRPRFRKSSCSSGVRIANVLTGPAAGPGRFGRGGFGRGCACRRRRTRLAFPALLSRPSGRRLLRGPRVLCLR
jgi:hypothetical protein